MVRKIVLSLIAVLGLCALVQAQNRQVTGTVVGADGSPVTGAVVLVDGTTDGTTTGADGTFSISAPANGTLTVSLLGYEPRKVAVAGKTSLHIVLEEDTTSIDDVVVVGYGSSRRVGSVIGSVDQVKAERLENRPTNNVMDAMQGQVAGLSITTSNGELNTTSTIRIHGSGSLSAGDEPLILLDGAPISSGTLMTLNQNDFESINILKDASATSIYGSRAANGVIYIVTKRGGRGSEDVEVTLRASYSMSSPITPKIKRMNTAQTLDYMVDFMPARYGDLMQQVGYEDGRQFALDFFRFNEDVDVDWYNEIFEKNAPMYQIDLSVSGGSKRTSYYFSGNYSDQTGLLPGSALTRYTFRSNIDTRATDWMKLGLNLSLGYMDSSMASTAATTGALYSGSPTFASIVLPSWQRIRDEQTGELVGFLDVYGDVNPLLTSLYTPQTNNRLQLNGQAFIELTPVKGLTLRSNLAANAFDYRAHDHFSPDMPQPSGAPTGTGWTRESYQRSYEWTWTNTAEYGVLIADKHDFTFLLGHESIYGSGEAMGIAVNGNTNAKFMTINQGTQVAGLPSFSRSRYAFNSVFGRVEYNFANRYYVNGLVRNDASSRFGMNKRNGLFWAAGAMWKISNEAFLRQHQTITDLSLKVSYGTQGNSGIGDYAQYEYLSSGYPYDGIKSWSLANVGNPNIGWESQKTLSVAASIGLWNRLSLEVEWYRRETQDMLMGIPKAPSSGFGSVLGNVGSMRNSGIDLTLDYDIVTTKDWYVNFHATFNYNKNQLTELWDPNVKEAVYGDMNYYVVGKPFPEFYGPEWRGVDPETGAPQWTAADGGITQDYNEAAQVDLNKSIVAPYTGGFGIAAQWKGISLTADFAWVAGNYIYNNLFTFAANPKWALQLNQVTDVLDYWKKPGDQTEFPALQYEAQMDSRQVEDASFLRLKNIQLGYSLPASLLRKSGFIKGVKVYVGARNLWTVTGYRGLDPEVSENVFDVDVYPNMRQWTFGCELKF